MIQNLHISKFFENLLNKKPFYLKQNKFIINSFEIEYVKLNSIINSSIDKNIICGVGFSGKRIIF